MNGFFAQFNTDSDLIETIIFLVVIAVSILGAIAKKLISVFTPPDKRVPPGKGPTPQRTVVRRIGLPIPGRPAPGSTAPGAQSPPLSSRPGASTPTVGPPIVRRPLPGRPVVIVEVEDEVAEPLPPRVRPVARPMPALQAAPPSSPTARPRREAAPAHTEVRLGHLKPQVLEEEARFETGAKTRMTPREPTVVEHEQRFEEDREGRLGYMDAETPGMVARKPLAVLVGRPSRQTIRQAIVLREILGSPKGLRPYDDPWQAL